MSSNFLITTFEPAPAMEAWRRCHHCSSAKVVGIRFRPCRPRRQEAPRGAARAPHRLGQIRQPPRRLAVPINVHVVIDNYNHPVPRVKELDGVLQPAYHEAAAVREEPQRLLVPLDGGNVAGEVGAGVGGGERVLEAVDGAKDVEDGSGGAYGAVHVLRDDLCDGAVAGETNVGANGGFEQGGEGLANALQSGADGVVSYSYMFKSPNLTVRMSFCDLTYVLRYSIPR